DRMAAEGKKLTSFYAAPVCSPSRAALMTGCYPKRALSIPHVLFPGYETGLAPDEVTIAELLKQQGYATGIIGKWHLGDQPEFLPTRQGFDDYFGIPYSNDMGPAADGVKSNLGEPLPDPKKKPRRVQPPLPLLRNETVLHRVLPDDQQKIVERYTQEAVSFLWKHRDEPFFLYLPHSAVHFPLYPGKRFHGKSQHGLFGDWVEEVDWSVGEILQTVRDLDLSANTMVLFTSDNGGQPRHGAINAPLRGGKGTTFEGGMRVPTIAWWPDSIPAGTTADHVTTMMDLLPTLVKLAGGAPPADRTIDGGDIWPILAGAADARTHHDTFYYYRGLKLEALRNGPWKLHLESGELYNLHDDIAESVDVSKKHSDIVAMLRASAEATNNDLGEDGTGPGCRPLGRVKNAQPLIAHDGTVREEFAPADIHAGQGIMVGEVTPTSALVQVRLTQTEELIERDLLGADGVVEFSLRPRGGGDVDTQTVNATPERDFIARASFTGLQPGTSYQCETRIGTTEAQLRAGPGAAFQTLPGAAQSTPVSLVVVTGMNHGKFYGDDRIDRERHVAQNNISLPQPYSRPDKHLGYPSLDAIRRLQPNFFVGTGDNIYYDTPAGEFRAKTLPEMRRKWHEQFVQPRYRDLFAVVPTYWMVDDHDYRIDDCDNTGDYEPSVDLGQSVMLEQLPYGPAADGSTKTYRTHRVSRDLQVWFPENRMYRSPNKMEDGPDKTIWGDEQKAWLMKTLAESEATFKLLISPTPMIGPDDKRKTDNHTNIGGFRHERDEFFAWLKSSGTAENFYLVCGDRHWQYRSVHPSGMEEFSCGALVDANSRLGRIPGDPKSTDPDGLIRQPYSQTVPSGGFLEIVCAPAAGEPRASLTFRFHDEHGEVLHEHIKLQAAR
ncbi:MAG: sulfatase-like hydrolase/transferase, partial [Planctomycetaceae bacterium]